MTYDAVVTSVPMTSSRCLDNKITVTLTRLDYGEDENEANNYENEDEASETVMFNT